MTPRRPRRPPIHYARTRSEAIDLLASHGPGCVLADVEATIAPAGTDAPDIVEALTRTARELRDRDLEVVYVTNADLEAPWTVPLLTNARKPFTRLIEVRQRTPAPVVAVWGDQPLTDGVLAARIGVAFVRQLPHDSHLGRRILRGLGRAAEPIMFRRP